MKVIRKDNSDIVRVELSKRNLEVLLGKLETKDQTGSFCTIEKDNIFITAVRDEMHYSETQPGIMLLDGELI